MIYDISDSKKIEDNIAIISDNIPWPSTLPDSTKILKLRYDQHTLDARLSYLYVTIQLPADQVLDNSTMPAGYHISHNEVQGGKSAHPILLSVCPCRYGRPL